MRLFPATSLVKLRVLFVATASFAFAGPPGLTTFDLPDFPTNYVTAIHVNNSGAAAIQSVLPAFTPLGWARSKQGGFDTFSLPGGITFVKKINSQGAVAGYFYNGLGVHGYIRDNKGGIRIIDVPGAVDTFIYGMNDNGDVTGGWDDGSNSYAFILTKNGKLTNITQMSGNSVPVTIINNAGDVTGYWTEGNGFTLAFFYSHTGQLLPLNVPGSDGSALPSAINDQGEVVGYFNASGPASVNPGFLRHTDGTFTTFNGLQPSAINNGGDMAGAMRTGVTSSGPAFIRKANGSITTFEVPGSTPFSTFIHELTDSGIAAGTFTENGAPHGFLLK